MWDFLWSRVGGPRRDHLVSWEICYKPKKEGELGLGNLVSKNKALAAKWLWHFPLQLASLWHQIIRSKYDLHPNGWDSNSASRVTHSSSWKFIYLFIFLRNEECY